MFPRSCSHRELRGWWWMGSSTSLHFNCTVPCRSRRELSFEPSTGLSQGRCSDRQAGLRWVGGPTLRTVREDTLAHGLDLRNSNFNNLPSCHFANLQLGKIASAGLRESFMLSSLHRGSAATVAWLVLALVALLFPIRRQRAKKS